MPLNYDKINIKVNGKYLLAESVSVSQEAPQKPLYTLNNSRPHDNTLTNLNNSINISYYIEPNNEPNYTIVSGWKNSNGTGNLSSIIYIGDVPFDAFLKSYSFDILPNQPIKAKASYLYFHQTSGNLSNQAISDSNNYNLQNGTGIAHYWAVGLTSGTGFATTDNNILQLSYNFNANLLPSYKLGSAFISQLSVLDASEEINMANEVQNNIRVSGQDYSLILNGIDNIRLKNLSSICGDASYPIDFSLSGFEVESTKLDISLENIIVFNHNLNRYY